MNQIIIAPSPGLIPAALFTPTGSVSFSVCEAFSVSPTVGQATVSGFGFTRQAQVGC